MIFPIQSNKIEQFDIDPTYKEEGYIWYNKTEKVYKTWINETISIFIMGSNNIVDINDLIITTVDDYIESSKFKISFEDIKTLNIVHNKGTKFFNYNIFDSEENTSLPSSISIIDENSIKVEFVDTVTGYIFMYFD